MARIELRNSTIRLCDGYRPTGFLVNNATPPTSGTTIDVDGGTGILEISSRFQIAGLDQVFTITATTETTGNTTNIEFTPAIDSTKGTIADDAALTFRGRSLEIKVGDGNLEYTEAREMLYDLNRGRLDTVRQGNDIPMEVQLDFVWEHLTAIAGATTPTISDVLHRRGAASDWESSSDDPCEPFALDIEVEYTPPCGDEPTEFIVLPDFRWESLPHNLDDAQISLTGKCNATEALVSRLE